VTRALRAARRAAVPALLLATVPAARAEEGKSFLGLLGGVTFPSNSTSTFSWGVTSAYRLPKRFGIGLSYFRYGVGASVAVSGSAASVQTSNVFYGLEGFYFFSGTLSGFSAGLKLGLANSTKSAEASSGSANITIDDPTTFLYLAPRLGYDYRMGRFSVGAEVSYVIGIGEDSPQALNVWGTTKFWF
jgi:hypothetical protein